VTREIMTPNPNLNSWPPSGAPTTLDWVGRNHGTFKLGVEPGTNGGPAIPGWNMATSNFLYCDGHVENKNIGDTVYPKWEWGDRMYCFDPYGTDFK
jgi:prepilin-type processing-associated H-X9-DG protein